MAFLPELLLQDQSRTLMFLPLAHVLARAVQVVCLSAGATLGHTPGAAQLLEDLGTFRPTFLLVVPRIFEKVRATAAHKAALAGKGRLFQRGRSRSDRLLHANRTGKAAARGPGPGLVLRVRHGFSTGCCIPGFAPALGGQVGYTVSGASPLSLEDAHFFRGAGIPVLEGYGLTETTAPCTANTPTRTRVGSVGIPDSGHHHPGGRGRRDPGQGHRRVQGLPQQPAGECRRLRGRLLPHRGPRGAGRRRLPDRHRPQEGPPGHGRRKERGPGPLEDKIRAHPLVGHAVVVGDGKPFVSALITLDPEGLADWRSERGLPPLAVARPPSRTPRSSRPSRKRWTMPTCSVSKAESIRRFALLDAEFTVESGHLTPSLKLKRAAVVSDFDAEVAQLYA